MGLADCSKGTGDPSAASQASPVSLQVPFCACTDPHGAAAAREGALHKRFFQPHTVWINVWDSKRLQISFLPCQGLMQSNSLHILQVSWEPGRNLLLFYKCFWGIFPASTTLQLCILSTKSNTITTTWSWSVQIILSQQLHHLSFLPINEFTKGKQGDIQNYTISYISTAKAIHLLGCSCL